MKATAKSYLQLHLLLLFSTLGGVCSKIASRFPLLSFGFFFFYSLLLLVMMIYAVLWQQMIKKLPLTTAYCNKAVTIIWGMLWGVFLFDEIATWNMMLGAGVVFIGVLLVVSADG